MTTKATVILSLAIVLAALIHAGLPMLVGRTQPSSAQGGDTQVHYSSGAATIVVGSDNEMTLTGKLDVLLTGNYVVIRQHQKGSVVTHTVPKERVKVLSGTE